MHEAEKPLLATHVKAFLIERYGSVAGAARELRISCDGLKNYLRRNNFNAKDLELLMPDQSIEELSGQFEFRIARNYSKNWPHKASSLKTAFRLPELEPRYISFINENPAVKKYLADLVKKECERLAEALGLDLKGAT